MSILFGFILACLVYAASTLLGESLKERLVKPVAFGLVGGVIHKIAPKIPAGISIILMLVVILMMAYLVSWWWRDGSTVKELVAFGLTDLLLLLLGCEAAVRIIDLTSSTFIIGLTKALPSVAFVLSLAFFFLDMIIFQDALERNDLEKYEDRENREDFFEESLRRWMEHEEINTRDSSDSIFDRSSECD